MESDAEPEDSVGTASFEGNATLEKRQARLDAVFDDDVHLGLPYSTKLSTGSLIKPCKFPVGTNIHTPDLLEAVNHHATAVSMRPR